MLSSRVSKTLTVSRWIDLYVPVPVSFYILAMSINQSSMVVTQSTRT